MATLLEQVAAAAARRTMAADELRVALAEAKKVHSWAELAEACGLSISGVRHLVNEGNGHGSD